MGVHGLSTYLRENSRSLSNNVQFPSPSGDVVPIVIDGWSFIYNLYYGSKLPWVYGGEYPEFSRLVAQVVEVWIQLRLKIYFVFDGPCPDLKFPTRITRLGETHVQPGLLFFRTSAASRTTPRFLHEAKILPPLSYTTCIHTLNELAQKHESLEIHYADEEGDPYSVELAGRVGGYVVGNDSDFAIMNTPGYLGYIPLDDLVWESTTRSQSLLADSDDDGDFQKVRNHKGKKRGGADTGNGAIPPEGSQDLRLTCKVYHPNLLASHLNLPISLLPLLSALVGNDFTAHSENDRRSIQSLFFERRLTLVQRIETAATAIRNALSPTLKRKSAHQVGSVMDLISKTVNVLLSRLVTPLGSGEVDSVIDKVVTATLQYAIAKHEGDASLWVTGICALHDPDLCPFLRLVSRRVLEESEGVDGETPAFLQSAAIRERYVQAYRSGAVSPKLIDVLNTGTSWPRLFLESPDLETVSRSITRPIRVWIYSVLDDSLGLPIIDEGGEETSTAASNLLEEGKSGTEESSDENELIDVAESDSEEEKVDFLAPLKGALQRLHFDDEDTTDTDAPLSVVSQRSSRIGMPRVTEYVRRGTKIAAEVVSVTALDELLSSISCDMKDTDPDADETISLSQKSPEERFTVFLRILHSDLPSVRSLPSEQLQPVLAIRWIARCLHARSLETGSRDREKEKWSTHEARCTLAAFALQPGGHLIDAVVGSELPPVRDRNVQISAQLLTTLETIEDLSQALLITTLVPSMGHRFSGKLLHSYLSGALALPEDRITGDIWQACRDNLAEAYSTPMKKVKKARPSQGAAVTTGTTKKKAGLQGAFSLLAGLDAV